MTAAALDFWSDTPAAPVQMPSARPAPSAAYMRGEAMPLFVRWQPALREASDDVKAAWRLSAARTVDSMHNSGFLSGAVEQSAASVCGNGLALNAKPNAAALGWTQDEANIWASGVETRFSIWAEDPRSCDAGARFAFGQQLVQAYRHWMATGEILATLPFFRHEGSSSFTKLKLLPAWRLSERSDGNDLVMGVRLGAGGAPRAYLIKVKTAFGGETEVETRATDSLGRPIVVHVFDGEPDQVRGISPFTSVLKVMRQFDQLADATLTTALIQTIFAAMFKSPAPEAEALAAMQSGAEQADAVSLQQLLTDKAQWYKATDMNLGIHGKVLHGFPGDELQFFRSEHPNANYESFARFLLRECSRAAAMTAEEFTGDYRGATFTSNKMATTVVWPRVLYRRRHIVAPLAQRVYEAWLEEDIEAGRTPFPGGVMGFLENRAAAAQAFWRGPTKPHPDDEKLAKAAEIKQRIGLPDSLVFEEYGIDPDDAYEEAKREQDRREALGLKSRAEAANGQAPDDDDDPDRKDREDMQTQGDV